MARNKKQATFKTELVAKDCLTVEIEGRGTFEVPLPNSLPISKMQEIWDIQADDPDGMKSLRWTIGFFREYLGDVVDEMTLGDFQGLSLAWQRAGSPDMGESSA